VFLIFHFVNYFTSITVPVFLTHICRSNVLFSCADIYQHGGRSGWCVDDMRPKPLRCVKGVTTTTYARRRDTVPSGDWSMFSVLDVIRLSEIC